MTLEMFKAIQTWLFYVDIVKHVAGLVLMLVSIQCLLSVTKLCDKKRQGKK